MSHPPEPTPSAIVILLHPDGEVYLVKRPKTSRFFPGFMAFPGGALEEEDGPEGELSTLRACAVRELEEEVQVKLDPEELAPAGRVITPEFSPIRYDTQFFLAPLPEGAEPSPQEPELAGGDWFSPTQALSAWRAGEIKVPPPVIYALEVLAGEGPGGLEAQGTDVHAFPIAFAAGLRVEPLEVSTIPPHTHTNCFVVGEEELAVIDPGASGKALDPLLGWLDELTGKGGEVAWVVLTHHHEDHVAGLDEVLQHFASRLACSRETGELLDRQPDRVLQDGDALEVGGIELRAIACPGHAPGHLAFHLPGSRAILAGDLVAGIGTVLVPPGEGDMAAYMESLEKVADLAEEEGVALLFPAHGPPIFQPVAKLRGTLEHRREREEKVIDALRHGHEGEDSIARKAYADTPAAPHELALMSTRAHLEKLAAEGRIQQVKYGWQLVDEG